MTLKEIRDLIDLITEKGISEFELERSGVRLRIRRGLVTGDSTGLPAAMPVPALPHANPAAALPPPNPHSAPVPAPPAALPEPAAGPPDVRAEDLHVAKAPIVGTFYEAPSPGAPPFVRVGDRVEVGQILCIIEAMKLMNEIESDVAGEIVKRYVESGQPVEYGESLFAIRPSKAKKN